MKGSREILEGVRRLILCSARPPDQGSGSREEAGGGEGLARAEEVTLLLVGEIQ